MVGNDRFHGQRGVHPHRNLVAGRTTLNAEMAKLLARSLVLKGEFDKDDYLAKYIEYMLTRYVRRPVWFCEMIGFLVLVHLYLFPRHSSDKDILIDKYHIEYFERFAVGNKPYYSAGQASASISL
jgi:hypothetical protein